MGLIWILGLFIVGKYTVKKFVFDVQLFIEEKILTNHVSGMKNPSRYLSDFGEAIQYFLLLNRGRKRFI